MLKILFFTINCLLFTTSYAQKKSVEDSLQDKERRDSLEVRLKDFEKDAEFYGGPTKWTEYLASNINREIPIKNKAPKGRYTVIIQFTIYYNGQIKEVIAETNSGYGMEDEVIRVIKNSPKWNPGYQNYRYVLCLKRQPFTFVVD